MAELGHTVVCADIDAKKINALKRGKMPIYELGLDELVEKNVAKGRLSFTTNIAKAIKEAEVVFNAVGTPEDKKTGKADLRYVFSVAEIFGKNINGYKILVNKSTVPVGTADECVTRIIKVAKKGVEFDVVSNPEFLREGAAIKDFLNPDRVIVGVASERARTLMEKIYRPLARAGRPVILTDVRSAELIKYASNAFLATKITFINEIANFCETIGANVKEVAKGMGADSRIGSRFLYAGIGYGGSCFPKDVQALIESGKEQNFNFQIVQAVDRVNDAQKLRPFEILNTAWKKKLKGKKVAVWGLSFKPRTDDVREAPAKSVIEALLKAGVKVAAYDPVAMESFAAANPKMRIQYGNSAYEVLEDVDAMLVMTEWDEFRTTDLALIQKTMKGDIVVDGRNIFERSDAEIAGLTYYGIGA
jgi:UDPglucose 6-dehydrogenase